MKIKDKIRAKLSETYGCFETKLEHEYENKIIEVLVVGDNDSKMAWITYNQVILELKNNLKDMLKVKELQYKLTETSDPNDVCIKVIEEVKNRSIELDRLYYKIKNF